MNGLVGVMLLIAGLAAGFLLAGALMPTARDASEVVLVGAWVGVSIVILLGVPRQRPR